MDLLKKFFPVSFGVPDVGQLVFRTILYAGVMVILGMVCTLVSWLLGFVPLLSTISAIILGAVSVLVDVYCVGGGVIMYLVYFKVIK